MNKLSELLKNHRLMLTGGTFGAAGGYLYWLRIGCTSGTCPVTSSPIMSVIWGAILGGLIFGMFQKKGGKQ
ncbi:MAG: DUF6132 family protein [Tannerella sp.]|nr:DUF6132 family protein [Tannerella sp.]